MRLEIFAYQVSRIVRIPGPISITLSPCDGVQAELRIEPTARPSDGSKGDAVWDRVWLNGVNVGNRAGAVAAFTEMVCRVRPEIDWE